jgi:hypothetical protein
MNRETPTPDDELTIANLELAISILGDIFPAVYIKSDSTEDDANVESIIFAISNEKIEELLKDDILEELKSLESVDEDV